MIKLYLERREVMHKEKSIKREASMLAIMMIITFMAMFVILYKGYKNQKVSNQIKEEQK